MSQIGFSQKRSKETDEIRKLLEIERLAWDGWNEFQQPTFLRLAKQCIDRRSEILVTEDVKQ